MYEQTSPSAADHQAVFALNELITATRGLAEALNTATRDLHADLDLSVSARGVLIALRQHGEQTVPDLARRRGVSRQFIQTVVNGLLKRDIVAALPNPAHRRSRLISLTATGTTLVRTVMRREGRILQGLAGDTTAGEIRKAAAVVSEVRDRVEGPEADV